MNNISPHFEFDNSFAREMDGFYASIEAEKAPAPQMVKLNEALAAELRLDARALIRHEGLEVLAGNLLPEGAQPLAQAYAGHQFGGFSPSLGDGRALLLGEVIDTNGIRRDIQLKGSGRTPFSRNGDGKAALGPVLREYLFSEAMHALNVPTTRSLAAVTTGTDVYREKPLPGAVLTRVATSHLRVGTFQFFAARGQTEKVRQLADYSIERHDPEIAQEPDKYLIFLDRVISRQTELIAKWMGIGFIHGVMNTDNMTISGETIDYGPCAFMDAYHPDTVFSSIDDLGRYAYKMQPVMAQWNLARFAESLAPLIASGDHEEAIRILTERIERVPDLYESKWLDVMRRKIGLTSQKGEDHKLINNLLEIMAAQKADFTQTFRNLSLVTEGDSELFLNQFDKPDAVLPWLDDWHHRLSEEPSGDTAGLMNTVNPVYIPRNHEVENVLRAAVDDKNTEPFEHFLVLLQRPYDQQPGKEGYESGAPTDYGPHITYCGT